MGMPKDKTKGDKKTEEKKRKKEKRFAFELGRSKIFQLPMTVYIAVYILNTLMKLLFIPMDMEAHPQKKLHASLFGKSKRYNRLIEEQSSTYL